MHREGERERTVDHILSACSTIFNTEYLQRRDWVASLIHWILCKNLTLAHTDKWYECIPQPVMESTEVTVLWDFTINADRKIEVNRPDIIITNFEENTCIMTDIYVQEMKIFLSKSSRSFLKINAFKLNFLKYRRSRPEQFQL